MHSQIVVSSGASTVHRTYARREPRSIPQTAELPRADEPPKESARLGGDGRSTGGAGGAAGVSSSMALAHGSSAKTEMHEKETSELPTRRSHRSTRNGAVDPPRGKHAFTRLRTAPSVPAEPRHAHVTIVLEAVLASPDAAPTKRYRKTTCASAEHEGTAPTHTNTTTAAIAIMRCALYRARMGPASAEPTKLPSPSAENTAPTSVVAERRCFMSEGPAGPRMLTERPVSSRTEQ
mmetsp:Transcript_30443/g.93017  ORF Transcript_30443/g.93017 Transcript_30443/m.93017 type:complete len:235 (+) Transcript_30443:926-1630(+)